MSILSVFLDEYCRSQLLSAENPLKLKKIKQEILRHKKKVGKAVVKKVKRN